MKKFFFSLLFIGLFSTIGVAQNSVSLPIPSETEYGRDILPQTVFLRLPANNKSQEVEFGVSIYVGKFLAEIDQNTKLPLFESYGTRSLINISAGQLQGFLLAQIAAGKITEMQVKETLDALVEAQKQVLAATEKLTNALIKAEYPFQPALTAIPKPK